MSEAFLHIRRTPTPGTWVRCLKAIPPGVVPGEFALVDRECVAWSGTSDLRLCRLWYVRVDTEDGFGSFTIDPIYPMATAYEGDDISLTACYRPLRDREVSEAAKLEESYHRRPARLHWAAWHVEQDRLREDQRAALKAQANAEHEQRERERRAAEAAQFSIKLTPPKSKPKPRGWLDRLLNRGRP
jgi:hypothetical protein